MIDLKTNEWQSILDIIYNINSIFNINSMREVFLQSIKGLIDYDFGIFDLCKTRDGKFISFIDPIVNSKYPSDFEEEFVVGYDKIYYAKSYSRWIHYEQEPIVYRETDFLSNEMREKSEYYKYYLKPKKLIYSCGCELISEKKNLGVVTLYREEQNGDFTDKELHILKLILPHLINRLTNNINKEEFSFKNTELFENKGLTNREMQILKFVCKGYDNTSISTKLFISVNTVKKHVYNIFSKLEVSTRMQLMSYYHFEDDVNEKDI